MTPTTHSPRGQSGRKPAQVSWSSPAVFILAASGAAIGFNNFWQFPSLVVKGGGGAFLLAYLAGVALVALPLLVAQIAIGHRTRLSPVNALQRLAAQRRADPHWTLLGWTFLLACFLILSYLGIFAGWTLAYTLRSLFGVFSGQTADGLGSLFATLVNDPEKQLFWLTLFVGVTTVISARGVRAGLEPFTVRAMAWLLVLLVFLLAYSATTPAFAQALGQMLSPDFEQLTAVQLAGAVGHAFFSLSLGVGVMLMYSAYVPDTVVPARAALWIAGLDTGVSMAATVIVLAVLGSGAVDLAAGPALVFQAMPLALDHLPLGTVVTPAFFLMLLLAAWMSALALAEPLVAWLVETHAWHRRTAAVAVGLASWVSGLVMMLSLSYWAFPFPFMSTVKKFGIFDLAQILTSHLLLPAAGLLIALFAGWALKSPWRCEELGLASRRDLRVWMWLVRVVVPLSLAVLMFLLPELFA
jgi:NSS family neurotransmitter:Na+ symporter